MQVIVYILQTDNVYFSYFVYFFDPLPDVPILDFKFSSE